MKLQMNYESILTYCLGIMSGFIIALLVGYYWNQSNVSGTIFYTACIIAVAGILFSIVQIKRRQKSVN